MMILSGTCVNNGEDDSGLTAWATLTMMREKWMKIDKTTAAGDISSFQPAAALPLLSLP